MTSKILIKPTTLSLILFSFFSLVISSTCVNAQSSSHGEYIRILDVFNEWKETQFKAGLYADAKKCHPDTVLQTGYTGPAIGVPGEMNIYFSDLNHDNAIDALITYSIDQCDESNGVMSVQRQLLVLSKGDTYYVDEKYFEKITSSLKNGWITVENAAYGRIYGSFHDFKNNNYRVPGISKSFSVVYPREKLEYR